MGYLQHPTSMELVIDGDVWVDDGGAPSYGNEWMTLPLGVKQVTPNVCLQPCLRVVPTSKTQAVKPLVCANIAMYSGVNID